MGFKQIKSAVGLGKVECEEGIEMAVQLSTTVRNAMLDALVTAIGDGAVLKIRSGTMPASVASADAGEVLATVTLPADWMAAAASGEKVKAGTWEDTSADASGTAGHFRLYASDGVTCHLQGTVTATGNGGDLTLTSITITGGQAITITGFTLSAGNV